MVSNLVEAMEMVIAVFHTYSQQEGDLHKLSRKELQQLLRDQFSAFLSPPDDSQEVDKILAELDENKDGQVDFQEFITLVAVLTVLTNEFFKRSSGDKK
ncbi:protein S100-A1 [Genypterus blacodes]|uniref:protein S100-A1 n=1 Tax=Genypterus blacodes TaxID=154954 RepID=UPI003F775A66